MLGTSIFGGCFWKWPVCPGGSGSDPSTASVGAWQLGGQRASHLLAQRKQRGLLQSRVSGGEQRWS